MHQLDALPQAGGTPDGGFRLEATMPSYVPTAEPAA